MALPNGSRANGMDTAMVESSHVEKKNCNQVLLECSKIAKPFYAPELDVLRFFAFLMVFCRHITSQIASIRSQPNQLSGFVSNISPLPVSTDVNHLFLMQGLTQSLDFGVCLFFFLSSFLITRLLLLEKYSTGHVEIKKFYLRRSLRIWPLYFTFIFIVVLASHWLPILHVERLRLLASLFFIANWVVVLHGWASIAIQPLWSISVEEQFYFFWPWVARKGRLVIIKMSLMLLLVSLLTLIYLGHRTGLQVTEVWPNTFVQMIFFAGGACTAVFSKPEDKHICLSLRLGMFLAGVFVWMVAAAALHIVRTNSPGTANLTVGYFLVLFGTFLIFSGIAGWNKTKIPNWMVYLGRISYGLYVFHVVCLVSAEQIVIPRLQEYLHKGPRQLLLTETIIATLGFLLTVMCAMASYKFLEKPFLLLKRNFTVVSSRPV